VSIRLMSAVFESQTLGPTERLIMLALADHADDEGRCYPSIERLRQRTGLSERAVQTNIRNLVAQGYVRIVVGGGKGNANLYFVSANPAGDAPRTKCTPAGDAPQTPQEMRANPAADAPEPSGTTKEPSEDKRAVARELEAWASPNAVASFMAYRRKSKAKALTLTGARRLAGHLRAIFDAGGDTDDALAMAEERGWQSVQADWYFNAKGGRNGNASRPSGTAQGRTHRPDPALENIVRLTGLGQA
jgi:hypothetical protein